MFVQSEVSKESTVDLLLTIPDDLSLVLCGRASPEAVTLHDFKAREEDELSFQRGTILYITDTDHYEHWSVMEKEVSFLKTTST